MGSKKKTIVFSLIFGIITIVLIGFVIYPLFKGIKKDSQEVLAAKKELILSKGEVEKFEELKGVYKELEPELEKIDKLFVDPEVPIDLIKFLEKTAANSELSIKISTVPLKTPETDIWNSIGFQITLVGSFSDFLKFLEKIETSPYLIEIQNLGVRKLTEGEIKANLSIKVFTK